MKCRKVIMKRKKKRRIRKGKEQRNWVGDKKMGDYRVFSSGFCLLQVSCHHLVQSITIFFILSLLKIYFFHTMYSDHHILTRLSLLGKLFMQNIMISNFQYICAYFYIKYYPYGMDCEWKDFGVVFKFSRSSKSPRGSTIFLFLEVVS